MHEVLLNDRVKGEREIALFRVILLGAMGLMVVLMALTGSGFNLSDRANLACVAVAVAYTLLLLVLIQRRGYRRWYGWASATVDILMISVSTYLSRYATGSSIASLVSSSSYAIYFPIILFSVRRHDPANTLYTGILAALSYGGMIAVMQVEGSFGVLMEGAGGLVIRNDLVNEALKALVLALTGLVGAGAALRFDRLFEDALREAREKEHIRDMFGRYVSDELVDKIMAKEIALAGEKREATIMFIDIRNFTSLAEHCEPKVLIEVLNTFFKLCIDTIGRHGGFIDKFIGDAIMAVFGAPEPNARHREDAISCAIELSAALDTMNAWVATLDIGWEFGYGIGLNSGEVIVGNVGTERRMEYTALGDPVNVASRLENLTRQVGKRILVGESCHRGVEGFAFEGPYSARLKGKAEPVHVYSVSGFKRD